FEGVDEDVGRLGTDDRLATQDERGRAGDAEFLPLDGILLDSFQHLWGGVVRLELIGIESELVREFDEVFLGELLGGEEVAVGEQKGAILPELALVPSCVGRAGPALRAPAVLI